MRTVRKAILFFLIVFIYSISMAFAEQNSNQSPDSPGRILDDGTWQPRNIHANLPDPIPGMPAQTRLPDNRDHILSISWESEVLLAPESFRAFYSTVAEGPDGYVYAATDSVADILCFFQSTDQGTTWSDGIYPNWSYSSHEFNFICYDNFISFIFNGPRCFLSSDNGNSWTYYDSWHQRRSTRGVALGRNIFVAEQNDNQNLCVLGSSNHGQTWPYGFGSHGYLSKWLQDMQSTSTKFHMVLEGGYGQEVYYVNLDMLDSLWTEPVMLSRDTTHNSFSAKIVAWGDSNVVAYWIDYEYSHYAWTGDIILRRSTDNGSTWFPEQQVTYDHLALIEHDRNMVERNDSLFLVYQSTVLDGETNTEEIFYNLSPDKGETWGEPVRLTEKPWRSVYPSIDVIGNRIHVVFCDARNDTLYGNHNSFYYKRGIIAGPEDIGDINNSMPGKYDISAYPNPFNSSTTISINIAFTTVISIYDITGRKVASLPLRDGKVVWDASPNSSGIYFARVVNEKNSAVIKLIYMK